MQFKNVSCDITINILYKNSVKLLVVSLMLSACTTQNTEAAKERMIGFHPNPEIQELQWHLGTQKAIDRVIALDKEWSSRNFEGMREFFIDSVQVTDPTGKTINNFEEFKAGLEAEDPTISWTFQYAYSVDIDPSQGGEHVQAGFKVTVPGEEDDVTEYYIHESYFIRDEKIVTLSQFKQAIQ